MISGLSLGRYVRPPLYGGESGSGQIWAYDIRGKAQRQMGASSNLSAQTKMDVSTTGNELIAKRN
jgi:hypothetical protein